MATHPTKREKHTVVFTTKNKSDIIALRRAINNKQNSVGQRAFNYLMSFVGLIHVTTGVLTWKGLDIESSSLEEMEDFYTLVYERVDFSF